MLKTDICAVYDVTVNQCSHFVFLFLAKFKCPMLKNHIYEDIVFVFKSFIADIVPYFC